MNKATSKKPKLTKKSQVTNTATMKRGKCVGKIHRLSDEQGNEEKKFALEENRYLSISKFRSDFKIHIRDWFQDHSGTLRPTKSGVVLTPKQWKKMKLLMKSVDEVLTHEKNTQ